MPNTEKRVVQVEDIVLLVDEKTTLHATTHSLKVDLELKEFRTTRQQLEQLGDKIKTLRQQLNNPTSA